MTKTMRLMACLALLSMPVATMTAVGAMAQEAAKPTPETSVTTPAGTETVAPEKTDAKAAVEKKDGEKSKVMTHKKHHKASKTESKTEAKPVETAPQE